MPPRWEREGAGRRRAGRGRGQGATAPKEGGGRTPPCQERRAARGALGRGGLPPRTERGRRGVRRIWGRHARGFGGRAHDGFGERARGRFGKRRRGARCGFISKICLPSVLDLSTRQSFFSFFFFSFVFRKKLFLCRVFFCRVFLARHSAKNLFAECPREYTRQT